MSQRVENPAGSLLALSVLLPASYFGYDLINSDYGAWVFALWIFTAFGTLATILKCTRFARNVLNRRAARRPRGEKGTARFATLKDAKAHGLTKRGRS
jgi:hypothetical protein